MNEDKAPAADRFLIRAVPGTDVSNGNPLALNNVNTVPLPDGAQCYVISEQAVFVLQKNNSGAYIASERLVPVAGPGRWVKAWTVASTGESAFVGSNGFNSFPVDDTWGQTTSTATLLEGTPTGWALTALGSILTYTGPTRDFIVTLAASVRVGNVGAPRTVFLGISRENDLTGDPTEGTSGEIDAVIAVASADISMTTVRKVTLATGQTIRPKMAGPAAATSLQAMLRYTVAPA